MERLPEEPSNQVWIFSPSKGRVVPLEGSEYWKRYDEITDSQTGERKVVFYGADGTGTTYDPDTTYLVVRYKTQPDNPPSDTLQPEDIKNLPIIPPIIVPADRLESPLPDILLGPRKNREQNLSVYLLNQGKLTQCNDAAFDPKENILTISAGKALNLNEDNITPVPLVEYDQRFQTESNGGINQPNVPLDNKLPPEISPTSINLN